MGDQDQSHSEFLLKRGQEFEHLGLNGYVQVGRRLVGNQEVGFRGQRPRDGDSLLHSTAELVRVSPEPRLRLRNLDELKEFNDSFTSFPLRHTLVSSDHFRKLKFDSEEWVER